MKVAGLVLGALLGMACSSGTAPPAKTPVVEPVASVPQGLPVSALGGFHWRSLVDASYRTNAVGRELGREIVGAMWDTPVRVVPLSSGVKPRGVRNCREYFSLATSETETEKPFEWRPFVGMVMTCQAAKALAWANESTRSCFASLKLDAAAPKTLPKQLVLHVSPTEEQAAEDNAQLRTWADVEPTLRFVGSQGETHAAYETESTRYEVELVGRGDVNADGAEDVLLTVQGSAIGGSYSSIRLFAIEPSCEPSSSTRPLREYLLRPDEQGRWVKVLE